MVVDMDMKSFFDQVNYDRSIYELSTRIGGKILLRGTYIRQLTEVVREASIGVRKMYWETN